MFCWLLVDGPFFVLLCLNFEELEAMRGQGWRRVRSGALEGSTETRIGGSSHRDVLSWLPAIESKRREQDLASQS